MSDGIPKDSGVWTTEEDGKEKSNPIGENNTGYSPNNDPHKINDKSKDYRHQIDNGNITEKVKETPDNKPITSDHAGDTLEKIDMKDIGQKFKSVITNPVFFFLNVFHTCNAFIISGFITFGPKFVENQYNQTPATAGLIFGE